MGIITDRQIYSVVERLGTATASLIYNAFDSEALGINRKRIATIVGPKLKQMARYGILGTQVFYDRVWYFIPSKEPDSPPERPAPSNSAERLELHIDRMTSGTTISTREAMDISLVSYVRTRRMLHRLGMKYNQDIKRYVKVRP